MPRPGRGHGGGDRPRQVARTDQTAAVVDGEDLSTPHLVRAIAAALGRRPRLVPVPPALLRLAGRLTGRSAAVARLLGSLQVDAGAFRRDTGWTPGASVVQGLAETAAWYRDGPAVHDQGN